MLVALCSGYALLPPIFSVSRRSLVQVPQLASFPFEKAWTLFLFGSNRMWTVSRLNRTWSYTMNILIKQNLCTYPLPCQSLTVPPQVINQSRLKPVPLLRYWLFNQTSYRFFATLFYTTKRWLGHGCKSERQPPVPQPLFCGSKWVSNILGENNISRVLNPPQRSDYPFLVTWFRLNKYYVYMIFEAMFNFFSAAFRLVEAGG